MPIDRNVVFALLKRAQHTLSACGFVERAMSRYHERYGGCIVTIVTERVSRHGDQPHRRVKSVLVTRQGINLNYDAVPHGGINDQDLVQRTIVEARIFLRLVAS